MPAAVYAMATYACYFHAAMPFFFVFTLRALMLPTLFVVAWRASATPPRRVARYARARVGSIDAACFVDTL